MKKYRGFINKVLHFPGKTEKTTRKVNCCLYFKVEDLCLSPRGLSVWLQLIWQDFTEIAGETSSPATSITTMLPNILED
jgi:hypothetical protein